MAENKGKKRLKEVLNNSLLVLASFVFTFVVVAALGEVFFRVFPQNYSGFSARPKDIKSMWLPEPDIGYINKPNFKLSGKNWWGCDEQLSPKGTRGEDFTVEKKDGTYRILALGDSVGFGIGLCRDKVFLSKLDENLNEGLGSKKFEVINASVSGYSAMQEYIFLLKYGQKWNPDMLIITLCPNDSYASENPFHLDKFLRTPRNKTPKNIKSAIKPTQSDSPQMRSHFLDFLIESLKGCFRYFGWVRRSNFYIRSLSKDSFQNYKHFGVLAADNNLLNVYKKIIKLCHDRGIKLLVAHIPYSTRLHWPLRNNPNPAEKLFKDNNIASVDFYDIFRSTIFKEKLIFFYRPDIYLHEDQCHLNEFGHKIVADKLAAMVRDEMRISGKE